MLKQAEQRIFCHKANPAVLSETTLSHGCCVGLYCADGLQHTSHVHVSFWKAALTCIVFTQHVTLGIHDACCAPSYEFNEDNSCIPDYRWHNFSSSLTHFEFFGCVSSWVFPLSNSLFCLRNQIVHTCLLPVTLNSNN